MVVVLQQQQMMVMMMVMMTLCSNPSNITIITNSSSSSTATTRASTNITSSRCMLIYKALSCCYAPALWAPLLEQFSVPCTTSHHQQHLRGITPHHSTTCPHHWCQLLWMYMVGEMLHTGVMRCNNTHHHK